MEWTNNTSCPLLICFPTFLALYFTSSVLASNYTTSCLSSYLAEWKNRKNQKRTCTNCSHHIYLPTNIYVHKLCLPRWTIQLLSMASPYACKSHAWPPKIFLQWFFLLFPASLLSPSWVISINTQTCYVPHLHILPPPKKYNICSHIIHWIQSYFSCPFKQTPGNSCLYLVSPNSLFSSLIALQSGHCPIHSTKIYLWPPNW